MLTFISWNVSPDIFTWGGFTLRWYSLLMAIAFLMGYYMSARMVRRDGYPIKIQENGTIYFIAGIILGARLGHCLFYEPGFYFQHPLQILIIWKGGLSSHGAVVGILVSMWIYARKVNLPLFWFIDKLSVVFLLAGFFVRVGNLMNSEAVGQSADVPWGFIFGQRGEDFARHPSQLYEALAYLLLFLFLYSRYFRKVDTFQPGYFTGLTFLLTFLVRFMIEYTKVGSQLIESIPLNTGQMLSIPFILIGGVLVWLKGRARPANNNH